MGKAGEYISDTLGGASDKRPARQRKRQKRWRFDPWVGKILWRRAWQLTAVFLPGESHGRRSLGGYCPHSVVKSQTRLSDEAQRSTEIKERQMVKEVFFPVSSLGLENGLGTSLAQSTSEDYQIEKPFGLF